MIKCHGSEKIKFQEKSKHLDNTLFNTEYFYIFLYL